MSGAPPCPAPRPSPLPPHCFDIATVLRSWPFALKLTTHIVNAAQLSSSPHPPVCSATREEVDWYRARPTAAVVADVRRIMDELTVRARRIVFEHPELLEADALAAADGAFGCTGIATANGAHDAPPMLGPEEQRRRAQAARAVAELSAIGLKTRRIHMLVVSSAMHQAGSPKPGAHSARCTRVAIRGPPRTWCLALLIPPPLSSLTPTSHGHAVPSPQATWAFDAYMQLSSQNNHDMRPVTGTDDAPLRFWEGVARAACLTRVQATMIVALHAEHKHALATLAARRAALVQSNGAAAPAAGTSGGDASASAGAGAATAALASWTAGNLAGSIAQEEAVAALGDSLATERDAVALFGCRANALLSPAQHAIVYLRSWPFPLNSNVVVGVLASDLRLRPAEAFRPAPLVTLAPGTRGAEAALG